jgi:hypothetical protein
MFCNCQHLQHGGALPFILPFRSRRFLEAPPVVPRGFGLSVSSCMATQRQRRPDDQLDSWAEQRPKEHRMERIRVADLDDIAQALDIAPVPQRSEVSKSLAIRTLAPGIPRMQACGHTAETIAEVLAANGIKITGPTLNNYLQRARAVPVASRK